MKWYTALKMVLIFTVLTGVIYPLFITGVAWLTMPYQAQGSLVVVQDRYVGSALIGQYFSSPRYFWSRPSAVDYHPLPSGGSNLGPTSAALKELVEKRKKNLSAFVSESASIPLDLLYASASGLDPHISLEAAYFQLDRVSEARGLTQVQKAELKQLIADEAKHGYVNVLLLNLKIN